MNHGSFIGTPGLGKCVLGLFKEEQRRPGNEQRGKRGELRSERQLEPDSVSQGRTLSIILSDGKLLESFAHCCNTIRFAF